MGSQTTPQAPDDDSITPAASATRPRRRSKCSGPSFAAGACGPEVSPPGADRARMSLIPDAANQYDRRTRRMLMKTMRTAMRSRDEFVVLYGFDWET